MDPPHVSKPSRKVLSQDESGGRPAGRGGSSAYTSERASERVDSVRGKASEWMSKAVRFAHRPHSRKPGRDRLSQRQIRKMQIPEKRQANQRASERASERTNEGRELFDPQPIRPFARPPASQQPAAVRPSNRGQPVGELAQRSEFAILYPAGQFGNLLCD